MLSRFSSRAIFPGLRVISQPHIHNILKDSTHATLPEMPQYKEGEQVRYKPVGGPESNTSESVGTIKGCLTQPGRQAERNVQASEEQPRYEIENANTGKTTTVYEANILGKA